MDDNNLLTNYNFRVDIEPSGYGGDEYLALGARGAFAEVQGLEISLETVTFREGGYHQGPRQLVGKTSTQPLILKRGCSLDPAFWMWLQRCTNGSYPLPYVSGTILTFSPAGAQQVGSVWRFVNGIVTKVTSANLDAKGSQAVPLEELHLVHEGLTLETP